MNKYLFIEATTIVVAMGLIMRTDTIRKIFDRHLEHDCFFDKKMFNVIEDSTSITFNTLPNKAMRIIFFRKEVNPSKLGKVLGVGKSTITSTIDTLEKEGLVIRKNDPGDMRRQLISLTEKGEKYHAELMSAIVVRIAKTSEMYGIEESELLEYYEHLSKMVEILNKHMDAS
jgi:DNA-binding MarR family transcriptional regulator